ncbi:small multidrug resistance pump [Streptoalloteichus tenebrarius]|uniref:Small multidrug resistance pump n=1 Tax=Streptoalloteichus tenebrarius (strain ATCC 17920 / DSM 40477 / JCM 4838 / CBS 697.72 / NBRC 16177 / NCIMB 11028 / NRRL B-12390 / A12253. 1 / ISP 5477) TaxID=1933 RepID=A0ABT1I444_STRSD|nr:SMR family transporter [Streptoalloteichus tenebrarius]MCP2262563.1 small multidrug resistance pump [Streptoalloteichus tenebrarius]BFF00753.1 multidrug efflux SMR transporter [Streptoalloteichus tenebrarius]
MAYLFLFGAVVAEVIGAIATRFSDGFTRLLPTTVTVVGVVSAYFLLSLALRAGMGIGVAYAIWAALGVCAVALIGALLLGDGLTWVQAAGIALVIGGVVSIELGGRH